MKRILIRNIGTLSGIHPAETRKLTGKQLNTCQSIEQAWLLTEGDSILDFGEMAAVPNEYDEETDAGGRFVIPAWCDSHTHLVFAETREREFVDRINGLSYEEIAAKGGGILNSAEKLNAIDEGLLFEQSLERLMHVRSMGTAAIEIKSGYGLSYEGELKMLRVIKRLKEQVNMPIKATFLGAHAVPTQYKSNREAYMSELLDRMLPQIAEEGLADYIDVFCDRGFFTETETDRILDAGAKRGLKAKIHANELDFTGGIQAGVRAGAISVDHLECTGEAEIECLKHSDTIATILPSTAFFLGLEYAPARKMIDNDLVVSLATDYNPGSSPSGNMAFICALACIQMKMRPTEALNAVTLNAAAAIELSATHGSICKGKKASLILTKPMRDLAQLPYHFAHSPVDQVMIEGAWI